jgi:predicted Zn-dependent peptidase/DMSO/TMAO reductase YedYZ heme-binding membrane subunit
VTSRGRIALKAAVWVGCLAPLARLLYRAGAGDLTANPISFVTNTLGDWTLRLLLLSLAMTPLRLVFGLSWPITLRRLLGLFAFFYVGLHFLVWLVLDHFFDWKEMGTDIVKRPYITVGMTALVLLIPLVATSTTGMIRRLGGVTWRRLHRLAYVCGALGVLHYLWLAKKAIPDPYYYAAALSLLLGVRLWAVARRWIGRRRASVVGSAAMRGLAGLLVAALTMLAAACGPVTRPASPPGGTGASSPTREVLPNGVVLISQEHRASEVVALQLWVKTGGRDERGEDLGLSHYLEHMLFKGTPTRPPGSIDTLVEGLGGQSNAFTSYDYTHYDLVLPARHLRAGLELLADIAVNASFVPEELESEKAVVLEEMRLVEDDPEKFLGRRLGEVAYRPHPYGRPLLGTPALIRGLTRARLDGYYRRQYVPAHFVVVAVGAVAPAEVRHLTEATFGRLPSAPPARGDVPPPPAIDRTRRLDVTRPEAQASLGLAWGAAATGNDDIYAVDLLTYILGDGSSSRLNQSLRERLKLVFAIDASYTASEKGGLVTVTARMEPANLERAEAAIREVIRVVRDEGVTEAERARAIITAESSYAFDIETVEGLAKTYGQAETTWTLDNELRYLTRLRAITAAQIQAVARRYLGDEHYARVRFLPAGPPR